MAERGDEVITINKITDAIISALSAEFGDSYAKYTDPIEQGLTEPCFFVQCLNPTDRRFLGRRRKRTNLYMIQYFPKAADEPLTEINDVIERLNSCLEYITVDGNLTAGSLASAEVIDGVLNYEIHYDMFTIEQVDTTPMGDMKLTNSLKEG